MYLRILGRVVEHGERVPYDKRLNVWHGGVILKRSSRFEAFRIPVSASSDRFVPLSAVTPGTTAQTIRNDLIDGTNGS